MPELIELLPHDARPRGNVKLTVPKGTRRTARAAPVTAARVDAMPTGRRGQRPGVLYDPAFPGCDPETWKCVVDEHETRRLLLPKLSGMEGSDVLDIVRLPNAAENDALLEVGEQFYDAHGGVRKKEAMHGGMKGAGDHIDPQGFLAPFACPPSERLRVAAGMQRAGRIFAKVWERRSVGWGEMLSMQEAVWPTGTPWWPQQWDVSRGLGNAKHADNDEVRAFAVWLSRMPGPFRSWWLLFPDWGVAIKLAHGTWVSWNGKECPHCTAVPADSEGEALMSVFCSLQEKACDTLSREIACEEELVVRSEYGGAREVGESGGELFARLEDGMLVSVKCAKELPEETAASMSKRALRRYGEKNYRWAACRVVEVEVNGDDEGPYPRVWLRESSATARMLVGTCKQA